MFFKQFVSLLIHIFAIVYLTSKLTWIMCCKGLVSMDTLNQYS